MNKNRDAGAAYSKAVCCANRKDWIALIWFGVLLAIMIEAHAKFWAPSLERSVGLDVGRQVFSAIGNLELLFSCILGMIIVNSIRVGHPVNLAIVFSGCLLIQVGLDAAILRPVLNARVELIIQGHTPAISHVHALYILGHLVKMLLLIGLVVVETKEHRKRSLN